MSLLFSGNCEKIQRLYECAQKQSLDVHVEEAGFVFDFESFMVRNARYQNEPFLMDFLSKNMSKIEWNHSYEKKEKENHKNAEFFIGKTGHEVSIIDELDTFLKDIEKYQKEVKSFDPISVLRNLFYEEKKAVATSPFLLEAKENIENIKEAFSKFYEFSMNYDYLIEYKSLYHPFGNSFFHRGVENLFTFAQKRKFFVESFLKSQNSQKLVWNRFIPWSHLLDTFKGYKKYRCWTHESIVHLKASFWSEFSRSKEYSWILCFFKDENISEDLKRNLYQILKEFLGKYNKQVFHNFKNGILFDQKLVEQEKLKRHHLLSDFFEEFFIQNPLLALFEMEILRVHQKDDKAYICLAPSYMYFEISFLKKMGNLRGETLV